MVEKNFYIKSHPPINFVFSHNARDFIVEEIPLYDFTNEGEHLILKVRKKNITTFELLKIIAKILQINMRDIGYAGLKDKNSLSYQFISVPNKAFKSFGSALNNEDSFKILESKLHNNKLKIGHLKGNRFFIRLKKVDNLNFARLDSEIKKTIQFGFPNFFGYQRFGNFGDNFLQGAEITKTIKKQNKHEKLLISSLQSFIFNKWLESRLEISSIINYFSANEARKALMDFYNINLDVNMLKVLKDSNILLTPLPGDILMHYPFGKLFYFNLESKNDLERLRAREIVITGLLSGINCGKKLDKLQLDKLIRKSVFLDSKDLEDFKAAKVWLANDLAGVIEEHFAYDLQAFGARRYAWVYPSDVELKYDKEQNHALLHFSLPSGAYATSFLEYVKNGNIFEF